MTHGRILRASATLLVAAVTLWSAVALAQDPGEPLHASLEITSEGRAPCLDASDLAARVEDILGRDVIREAPARLHIQILVRREGTSTLATVRLLEDGATLDERDVVHEGRRCRALAGPLSVVLAMLLDDSEQRAALDVTSAAEPVVDAPVIPVEESVAPVEAAPAPVVTEPQPAPSPWRATVAPGVAVSAGFLPGVTAGADLRGRVGPTGDFAAMISLTVFPWATVDGEAHGELSGFIGALGACSPRWTGALPLSIGGCLAVGGGAIRGSATGIEHAYERFEAWIDVEALLEVNIALGGPVALSLHAGVLVPVLRPVFYVRLGDRNVTVHDPWPVVPMVVASVALGDP